MSIIYTNSNHSNRMNNNDNEIRKFQCANCRKSKLVLKKVTNQQHHGFACDECWIAIDKQSRFAYGKCDVQ